MAENKCNGTHKYGLWNNNSRVCVKCGYIEELPLSESIKAENKKQEEAKKTLDSFLNLDDNSLDAIKGIQIILEKYINYLSPDSLAKYQEKVKQVGIANNLNELDISCIYVYTEKLKKQEDITEIIEIAFDEFKKLFAEEIKNIITSYKETERKATLS